MTKTNKNQQNRTKSGLTPIQEQAAILLASGETITAISEKLDINRSTIYEWLDVLTFKCFYNKQCEIVKEKLKAGLFGLQKEAIKAIKESLQSDNLAIKLKAAMWMVERLSIAHVGETDPIPIIRKRSGEGNWLGMNEEKFERLLEEYHLEDRDYNDLPKESH